MLCVLLVGLAVPAATVAHGDHPAQTSVPAPAPGSDADSGGGASPWLVGGLVVGFAALVGALLYVKQRQAASPTGSARRATPATREAKRRARRSW